MAMPVVVFMLHLGPFFVNWLIYKNRNKIRSRYIVLLQKVTMPESL